MCRKEWGQHQGKFTHCSRGPTRSLRPGGASPGPGLLPTATCSPRVCSARVRGTGQGGGSHWVGGVGRSLTASSGAAPGRCGAGKRALRVLSCSPGAVSLKRWICGFLVSQRMAMVMISSIHHILQGWRTSSSVSSVKRLAGLWWAWWCCRCLAVAAFIQLCWKSSRKLDS